jgi:hypothetical protein
VSVNLSGRGFHELNRDRAFLHQFATVRDSHEQRQDRKRLVRVQNKQDVRRGRQSGANNNTWRRGGSRCAVAAGRGALRRGGVSAAHVARDVPGLRAVGRPFPGSERDETGPSAAWPAARAAVVAAAPIARPTPSGRCAATGTPLAAWTRT